MTQSRKAGGVVLMVAAALASVAVRAGAQVPPFTQCPPVATATGCQLLIVVGPLSISTLFDFAQPPFDLDDTLVGVQNNSSQPIASLSLSSPTDIFGFDFDGLCNTFMPPPGCPFGPTGYEGPGVSFGNIGPGATSGTVSFSPAIPPGGSAFFALEEGVTTVSVGICGDGIVEPGEACDNGSNNGTAASCCTTTCTPVCDDGNVCTDDVCDSTGPAFVCSHTDNTAPCQTGNACILGETCSGGACGGGTPRICNDFNPCTDDHCDSVSGCFVTSNNNPCNDGNACTSNDHCTFGFCSGTANNNPCTDFNACTTNDHCQFGFCSGGTPVDCNDNNPCTTEFCDTFFGCRRTNLDGIQCNDHNPCTTDDTCHTGTCTGDPRNCLDDDP